MLKKINFNIPFKRFIKKHEKHMYKKNYNKTLILLNFSTPNVHGDLKIFNKMFKL